MVKFTWDIHYSCNYRCPYCWFFKKWVEMGRQNVYLSVDELTRHWKRIVDKYGEVKVEIVGGEPFTYPNFIDLVRELSKIMLVKVTTNLSGDIDRFVREVSPERVNVDLNYHPLFISAETVIKKARLLNDSGFKCSVCYLAYPPQMRTIESVSKKFEAAGVGFALAAFWGQYNGLDYPQGYSEEEKEMMKPYLGDFSRLAYHLEGKSPRGRLCNAGHKYAGIHANGDVVRCGPMADTVIGNIFSGDFSLYDEPMPCEADSCPCNEYDNLVGDNSC